MTGEFSVPGVPEATGHYVESLPLQLEGAAELTPFWWARPGAMLLRVPGIAAFLVADGRTITIAPSPGTTKEQIEPYLNGAVRAALLQQRGEVALHATCLLPPGKAEAVAICGASVMGKSTLAAELCRRGWKLLSDNLVRVTAANSELLVWPSDTHVQLWKDACESLGIVTADLMPVRKDVERYRVPMPAHDDAAPLGLLLGLRFERSGQFLERLHSPADRAAMLGNHTYRRRQIAALGVASAHAQVVFRMGITCQGGLLYGARTRSITDIADRAEEALQWMVR